MSRPEIIKLLKQRHPKLSHSILEKIIDITFENIKTGLKEGKTIELRGFGTFFTKIIKEKHSARNPKTGELIYVPEKYKIRFKASKKLNKFINEWENIFL